MVMVTTRRQALNLGRRNGAEDAVTVRNEHDGEGRLYRSVRDAVTGWGERAAEAASLIRVPSRWVDVYRSAYERAAARTALELFRSDCE